MNKKSETTKAVAEIGRTTVNPEVGACGEVILPQEKLSDTQALVGAGENPKAVTADASWQRLDLAEKADCLSLAVDMAETIQARNSLEEMLAHQMAAAHSQAMRLIAKSYNFVTHTETWDSEVRQQVQSIEAVRMANAAARLMKTYQDGMLALNKLRTGGKQTILIQHVNVNDGGQAVVAGNIDKRGNSGGNDGK
ncbi:MAG: hypothetical protein IIC55_08675 [Proteobacteria bacterium]|nr:hypothetical protein [Pseudomonadota bacterium]